MAYPLCYHSSTMKIFLVYQLHIDTYMCYMYYEGNSLFSSSVRFFYFGWFLVFFFFFTVAIRAQDFYCAQRSVLGVLEDICVPRVTWNSCSLMQALTFVLFLQPQLIIVLNYKSNNQKFIRITMNTPSCAESHLIPWIKCTYKLCSILC